MPLLAHLFGIVIARAVSTIFHRRLLVDEFDSEGKKYFMRFMMKLFVPDEITNKPFIDPNYSVFYEFESFSQYLFSNCLNRNVI